MKTSLKLSTFSGGVAVLCFFGLMVCAAEPAVNCWPFTVGNTWTVETKINDKSMTQVLTVTKVTPGEGGSSDATVEYKVGDNVVQTEIYRFDKGITRVASGAGSTNIITPPIPVVQYSMVSGRKWSWRGTVKSGDQELQATADFLNQRPRIAQACIGRVSGDPRPFQPFGDAGERRKDGVPE
jgi:hypothetical protein